MNILTVDTSGPIAGVSIITDGAIRYEASVCNKKTHSVNLMPMVDEAFNRSSLTVSDIDIYAAVVGPGSFTGVRIGVNTIRGMAHGVNKPVIGINALEALACGVCATDMIICPIQDARAGQVYGAVFESGMPPIRLMQDEALILTEYLSKVCELADSNRKFYFVGDGARVQENAIKAILGERAVFAPAHLEMIRPASVAMLADCYKDSATSYNGLLPHYLRKPQAERAREAKLRGESNG